MESNGHIFIVEDRDSLRRMMVHALTGEGYRVTDVADVATAQRCLVDHDFDLVLTDLQLPDGTGLDVLAACRQARADMPVVVLTAFGTVSRAVEAMKLGATDFLEKPVEIDQLFELSQRLLEQRPAPLFEVPGAPPIVGNHPRLATSLGLLRKVAPTESTVLLTGESGTGKGLFAQALHGSSRRAGGPFVAVNCAAIPVTLMENELFGHEKGAFTGANRRQEGRFELARGGTLFLDEIGELEPGVQGKVLRVLEEKTFERVGGGRPIQADVRVVAATNRDLLAMTQDGSFRLDLYYRLDVFPIELPPLRERASDIPALAQHLVGHIAERLRLPCPELTDATLELLSRQPWPGNVRQLANLLERGVILSEGGTLDPIALEPFLESATGEDHSTKAARPVDRDESEVIREAMLAHGGDKQRVAADLGMSYRSLQRKIQKYDLEGVGKYRR